MQEDGLAGAHGAAPVAELPRPATRAVDGVAVVLEPVADFEINFTNPFLDERFDAFINKFFVPLSGEPEGKVTTDFPRVEFVKNLDMLDKYARINRNNMSKFVIKDSKGKVRGYFEMLPEYTTIIWEYGDDILLQVIIPNSMGGNSDGTGDGRRSGGKHGGR